MTVTGHNKKNLDKLHFTHIHLQNWRNFINVDVDLQDRIFLVGPNASGKSNFLDVFRFLEDLVTIEGGGLQSALKKRGGVSGLRSLAARQHPDVVIDVSIGNKEYPELWRYKLHFNQDKQKEPRIIKEQVFFKQISKLNRPYESDKKDPARLTQTYLENVTINREFRDIAEFFKSIRYLHIVPQLIREPDRSFGHKNDPFGGDFLDQIMSVNKKTRESNLKKIEKALNIAVPHLTKITIQADEKGKPHLKGNYEHWRPQGAWQTEKQFSDGTLRLMGLLWSLLNGSGPLLLEEPELSLHPEIIRHIPQMFARIQRKTSRQIITSTHSSELLLDEGIGLDEVLLLIPSHEGTEVKPASSIEDAECLLQGGSTLADVVIPSTSPKNSIQLSRFGD